MRLVPQPKPFQNENNKMYIRTMFVFLLTIQQVFLPFNEPHDFMNDKANKLSGAYEPTPYDLPVPARTRWRRDGPFIVDATGKRVVLMQGELAEYEWPQRRVLAAVNALQDTPTQYIEELVEKCPDNILLGLISREREMAATLQRMEENIAAHCREIEQLREIMNSCRVFEEQRTLLQQAPGSAEYEALLHALKLR